MKELWQSVQEEISSLKKPKQLDERGRSSNGAVPPPASSFRDFYFDDGLPFFGSARFAEVEEFPLSPQTDVLTRLWVGIRPARGGSAEDVPGFDLLLRLLPRKAERPGQNRVQTGGGHREGTLFHLGPVGAGKQVRRNGADFVPPDFLQGRNKEPFIFFSDVDVGVVFPNEDVPDPLPFDP